MRNRALIFALLFVPLLGIAVVTWLSATVTYTATWQGRELRVTRDGRWIRADVAQTLRPDPHAASQPQANPVETSHDFGLMDPLTMGRHTFVIRNEGTAPLLLKQGPTTCKCTLSKISRDAIEPGEEGGVVLDWNTGRDLVYSHEATIYTNDPTQSAIRFRVHGTVRKQLGSEPPVVNFGGISPGDAGSAELLVYSQVWDDFEIVGGETNVDGLTWSVERVPPDSDALDGVEAVRRILVRLPPDQPQGDVSGQLTLRVQPSGGDPTELQLPVTGKVFRRLAVYGPAITVDGVIDMGHTEAGESLRKRLVLKVRDELQTLPVTAIRCEPEFIQATIVPYRGQKEQAGLMYLDVEIPATAPACSYLGVPLGDLRIEFDHPRIPSLDLKVKFAVMGHERKAR